MCPKFCTDAKPYKHTQTLALRKARCDSLNAKPYKHTDDCSTKSERDSAVLGGLVQREAIPPVVARIFFGRQHLTFDKGGKGDGDF